MRTHLSHYYLTTLGKAPVNDHVDHDKARRRYEAAIEKFSRFLLNNLFTPKRIGLSPTKNDELPALTREFLYELAQQFKRSVELYFKLSTPSECAYSDAEKMWLERTGRLLGYSPSNMLLAIYKNETRADKRIAILKSMERYSFLASLSARSPHLYSRR